MADLSPAVNRGVTFKERADKLRKGSHELGPKQQMCLQDELCSTNEDVLKLLLYLKEEGIPPHAIASTISGFSNLTRKFMHDWRDELLQAALEAKEATEQQDAATELEAAPVASIFNKPRLAGAQ